MRRFIANYALPRAWVIIPCALFVIGCEADGTPIDSATSDVNGEDAVLSTPALESPEASGSGSEAGEYEPEIEPGQFIFGAEPPPDPPWIDERGEAQIADAEDWTVEHDFSFTDQLSESGITFVQHPVPDGAKSYKPNHYDHGNGIAVADVDGDGLLDLYFSNQVGSNGLWRNLGQGRFEDITDASGVGLSDVISVAGAFGDVDNDGDPDLFVTTVLGGNRLFLNDGLGAFSDGTEEAGVSYSGHSSAPTFFDYDKDGWLDLFVANVGVYTTGSVLPAPIDPNDPTLSDDDTYTYVEGRIDAFAAHIDPVSAERSILYRNQGQGVFEDVSAATGFDEPGWNGDASPIDVNSDGWPDLYITDMQGDDDYWENIGGQSFEKRTDAPFPRSPWGAMGIKALDWDNDGLQDLFITDMHSDMVEDITIVDEKKKARGDLYPRAVLQTDGTSIFGNAFFHQQPDGSFEEVSDQVGAENYWPWGLSIADLNADGFDDAFIASSMNYAFRYGVSSVLLNEGGTMWRDAEFVVGVEPRPAGQYFQRWYTLDCDGVDAEHLDCLEHGPGLVTRWEPVGARASVIADLDGDGDLDIVMGDYAAAPRILMSDLAQRGSATYIEIDLVGSTSNRDGLGATVVVEVGDQRQTKVNDGKSGYLSQSDMPLYFGMNGAEAADRVTVTWPSGTEQVIEGPIASGVLLEIVEP